MRLYIEIHFSSEGSKPMDVIKEMKDKDFQPVVGECDFYKDYNTPEEYAEIIREITETLKGTDTRYRLITRKE